MTCAHEWVGAPIPTCTRCGIEPHASPSQIAEWRLCRRRHWYSRRRPRADNPFANFGTVSHKIRERWLRHSEWPASPVLVQIGEQTIDARACVAEGLPYWPAPKTCNAVEPWLEPVIFGTRWKMAIDSIAHYVPDRYILIEDLKTTGDLKWAKTPEQLRDDPQWIVYGGWAALTFETEYVAGQWTYCRRKPPKAQPVQIVERSVDLIARLGWLVATEVLPMLASYAEPAPPRDGIENGACDVFGREGCPHRSECLADIPPEQIVAIRLARSVRPVVE